MLLQTDERLNVDSNDMAKYGCYWCSLLATGELLCGERASLEDVWYILGRAYLDGYVKTANYQDHEQIQNKRRTDVEWHYWVHSPIGVINATLSRLQRHKSGADRVLCGGVDVVHRAQDVRPIHAPHIRHSVSGHLAHFTLWQNGSLFYNPDPRIDVEKWDVKKLVVPHLLRVVAQ